MYIYIYICTPPIYMHSKTACGRNEVRAPGEKFLLVLPALGTPVAGFLRHHSGCLQDDRVCVYIYIYTYIYKNMYNYII